MPEIEKEEKEMRQMNPKQVKRINDWARVSRNPSWWKYRYSVEVKDGGAWGVFSQHRLLKPATDMAKKVIGRYRSGHEALTTPSKLWGYPYEHRK